MTIQRGALSVRTFLAIFVVAMALGLVTGPAVAESPTIEAPLAAPSRASSR
jgi:hypothetical protein